MAAPFLLPVSDIPIDTSVSALPVPYSIFGTAAPDMPPPLPSLISIWHNQLTRKHTIGCMPPTTTGIAAQVGQSTSTVMAL